ncbi:MAG: carboxypeptidase-like regulatory domain-containing protein [Bacteroidota bacterium]
MRIIGYILTLLISLQALAQSDLTITGTIIDEKSGEPLAFATVGIKGSPHGTISNPDGQFSFFIPSKYLQDTLTISHVGFESSKWRIEDAINKSLNITLKESITILEEVLVNGDKLTAKQIMKRALEKLGDNYSENAFIASGFFRDIREQNQKTVYLVEAAVDIEDPGYKMAGSRPKKFFLKGVRASDSRVNGLLRRSLLNAGNSLTVNLERNFWLNRLRHELARSEFSITEILNKDDRILYSIETEKVTAISPLADHHSHMEFTLTHRYLVDAETYAIYKVEHIETPHESEYIGIEPPYEGDSLFYSKKGWNQVIEFEEYQGKMFLKYHDVVYAFDIVDEKNNLVHLDMKYQFVFTVTDIKTGKTAKPADEKMNKNKPLLIQAQSYDSEFWTNPANAKLVPLTRKQLNDLAEERPLEEQFRSKKTLR